MKRKSKGWGHRWQLILRPTELQHGVVKNRWHKIKLNGRNQCGGTYGYLNPHPGDDIADDRLLVRANLQDVTVPVEILRALPL